MKRLTEEQRRVQYDKYIESLPLDKLIEHRDLHVKITEFLKENYIGKDKAETIERAYAQEEELNKMIEERLAK